MGAFLEAVPIFAPRGVPVIPTRHNDPKRPERNGWQNTRPRDSERMLADPRFKQSNAGIVLGKAPNLTIVDADTSDPVQQAEIVHLFGESPLVVETPSGGQHHYFANSGGGRLIRVFGDGPDALPVDLLHDGFVGVPPSVRPQSEEKCAGQYKRLAGDFSMIGNLPAIKNVRLPDRVTATAAQHGAEKASNGKRNTALARAARELAARCNTKAEHLERVLALNATYSPPLPINEAQRTAAGAWKYKVEDRLFLPGNRYAPMVEADFSRITYLPAFSLLAYLRLHHAPGHTFAIAPEALAAKLPMTKNTIRTARDYLVDVGYLTRVSLGGLLGRSKTASQYRFSTPGA